MAVQLGDLNVATQSGAQSALRRIRDAADGFCGGHGVRSMQLANAAAACRAEMTDKAVAALQAPRVTALHCEDEAAPSPAPERGPVARGDAGSALTPARAGASPSFMAETPVSTTEIAEHMIRAVPHGAALGMQVVSTSEARGSLHVPFREDLIGDPETEVIAGGVVTALLDHCCGLAIKSARADMSMTATLDLRIDYLRPAKPRSGITAEAHCYKLTRSIAFVRAQAWDESADDPVATAQAAFMLTGAPA